MTRRLLVLACSATKTKEPGRISAYQRYDGPLWQTLRATDPERTKTRVAFVSARFGFRCATTTWIENYNEPMTAQRAAEMISGGMTGKWPKAKPTKRITMGCGVNAWAEIVHLTYYGERPFTDVAIAGGRLYLDVMRNLVELFKQSHWDGFENTPPYVKPEARVTEINGSIGIMRKELREWVLETPVTRSAIAAANRTATAPTQRELFSNGGSLS